MSEQADSVVGMDKETDRILAREHSLQLAKIIARSAVWVVLIFSVAGVACEVIQP